jgi:SNF2 family DNA or RNA helicase
MVDDFNKSSSLFIFLLSTRAGGVVGPYTLNSVDP